MQLHTGETDRRKLLNFYKEMLRIFKNPNKKYDESLHTNFKLTQPRAVCFERFFWYFVYLLKVYKYYYLHYKDCH